MVSRFTVYPGGIQASFEPGGAVYENANIVGLAMVQFAKAEAPVRTSALRDSIRRLGRGIRNGALQYVVTVRVFAAHGNFVLFGTNSPITPFYGRYLSVPRFKGSAKRVGLQYVRGQKANDFLNRGGDLALTATGYGPIMHETVRGYAS